MKITFLGTGTGQNPSPPEREHSCYVLESQEKVFWFDTGEGCSKRAHVAGIDLQATEVICISHTHIDHIGGLPNLLACFRPNGLDKLWGIRRRKRTEYPPRMTEKKFQIFMPDLEVWESMHDFLVKGGVDLGNCSIELQDPKDGIFYDKDGIEIHALHTRHIARVHEEEPWRSYAFKLQAEGKSVVYSGDISDISDLTPLLDPCDLLIVEVGHPEPRDVFKELSKYKTPLIALVHLQFLQQVPDGFFPGIMEEARKFLGDRVFIPEDGMILRI